MPISLQELVLTIIETEKKEELNHAYPDGRKIMLWQKQHPNERAKENID